MTAETMPARLEAPLRGFRIWIVDRYSSRRPRLMAATFDVAWEAARVTEARCLFDPRDVAPSVARRAARLLGHPIRHAAPASNCGCGLHAYDCLWLAVAYTSSVRLGGYGWRPGPHNPFVVGAVLLWGDGQRRVQVGDLRDRPGLRFRAPFARVLALMGPSDPDDVAYEVGPALGLPVLPARGLELYALEHGARCAKEVAG